jgi:hypothetical protein
LSFFNSKVVPRWFQGDIERMAQNKDRYKMERCHAFFCF